MKYNTKFLVWTAGLIILAAACGWWIYHQENKSTEPSKSASASQVEFICASNKTINATFRDGSAEVKLSDGRHQLLKHVISASGARYTNEDKSLVFWNKGNTAFVSENDSITFKHCVIKGQDDLVKLETYANHKAHFRLRYPRVLQKMHESVADTSGWSYAGSAKGDLLVQFKLSTSVQPKTNLAEATFTVGKSDRPASLRSCLKVPQAATVSTDSVTKGQVVYLRSRYGDAGAGNFYDIIQYRTLHDNSCYSMEEMVHSTNIHNYPKERGISAFDSARVWKALAVPFETLVFPEK